MGFLPSFGSSEGGSGLGAKAIAYGGIEAVWLTALYAACFRYRPSVRFIESPIGGRVVHFSSAVLKKYLPSSHAGIVKLSERAYGSPNGRTFGEWLLINKVVAPVSFPTKLWLAHRLVERRMQSHPPSVQPHPPSVQSPSAQIEPPVAKLVAAPVEQA